MYEETINLQPDEGENTINLDDQPIIVNTGGTNNYRDLTNKPQINGVTLLNDKTSSELGLQSELVSGTNIKTINENSILGSGDLHIDPAGGSNLTPLEVPDDYMNLMGFITDAEMPETYTISNDNDVTIDVDKEDTIATIYVSKGSIISVYPGWSATILTGDGQYTYFNYGEYLYGGVSLNDEEVEAIIDEKLGDTVVMTNTDQTISGQKKFTSPNGTIFENSGGVSIRNLYSAPPLKITPDNNGNFDFYYDNTHLGRIDAYNSILYRALRPNLNESVNLGASSYNWNNIYAKALVSGQSTKTVSKLLTNDSSLIPESNNLYTLGNAGYQWSNLYLYNTLRFDPQANNKIDNLKNLTVNTVNLGGQIGGSTTWDSNKFLQYDTTNVKYKGKIYAGLDFNNQPVRNIPDTPDEGTSPINKNYADTNLQGKLTAGNKLSSDLVDDTNQTNLFVTSSEKSTWNAKSDFSGNYNDLTNKPTIPTATSDLQNDSNFVSSAYATTIWVGTQAEYDLLTPDANTIYCIKES